MATALLALAACQSCEEQVSATVSSEVLARLSERIDGEVQAGEVQLRDDGKRVTLRDATLTLENGALRYTGGTLIVELDDSGQDTPRVVTLEGGRLELPGEPHTPTGALPDHIVLSGVRLRWMRKNGPTLALATQGSLEKASDGHKVRATLEQLSVPQLPTIDRLVVDGAIHPGLFTADSLVLTKGDATMRLDALSVRTADARVTGGLLSGQVPLSLLAASTDTPLAGEVAGTLTLSSPADIRDGAIAFPVEFTLTGATLAGQGLWDPASGRLEPSAAEYVLSLRPAGDAPDRVSIHLPRRGPTALQGDAASPTGTRVEVTSLALPESSDALAGLSSGSSRISGVCHLPPHAGALTANCSLRLSQPNLAPTGLSLTAPELQLEGTLSLTRDGVQGSAIVLSMPKGGALSGVPFQQAHGTLDALATPRALSDIVLRGSSLALKADRLSRGPSDQRPTGVVEVQKMPLSLLQKLTDSDLGALGPLTGQAKGKVSWDASRPGATVDLTILSAHLASFAFSGGSLHMDRLANGAPQVDASLEQAGGGRLQLSTDTGGGVRIEAERLATTSPLSGVPARVTAQGTLSAKAQLRGTMADANGAQLDFALDSNGTPQDHCNGPPIDHDAPFRLCANDDMGTLAIDLSLYTLQGPGHVKGRVKLSNYDLWPADAELEGQLLVSGLATLQAASIERLGHASGELHLTRLTLKMLGEAFEHDGSARHPITDGQVELDRAVLRGRAGELTLTGPLGRGAGSLHGEAHLSAERLAKQTPLLTRASGTLTATLTMDDHFAVDAHFEDLVLHARDLPTLSEVQGKAHWEHGVLRFADVQARVAGGTVTVNGTLGGDGSTQLALHAAGLHWAPKDRFELGLSADGTLTQKRGDKLPLLKLDVGLSKVAYGRRIQFPEVVMAAKDATSGAPADASVALDLTLRQTGPWHIDNGVLSVTLKSPKGLRVAGTDSHFGLLGTVQVSRGSMRFYNDSFTLSPSTLRFTDAASLAVHFDLKGRAQAKRRPGAIIALTAKGDDRDFDVRVRCEASDGQPVPPSFHCTYDGQELTCPHYRELVTLWVCKAPREGR